MDFSGQGGGGKIKTTIIETEDPDSVDVGIEVNSGLGVLDAFFASLSMIIVSEVSLAFLSYHYIACFTVVITINLVRCLIVRTCVLLLILLVILYDEMSLEMLFYII